MSNNTTILYNSIFRRLFKFEQNHIGFKEYSLFRHNIKIRGDYYYKEKITLMTNRTESGFVQKYIRFE